MKRYWNAYRMCQSMFCAIPFPCRIWDEEARPLMLLFLPAVGLEMGILWAGLGWICRRLSLPGMVTGIVLCAFPYLVSGFMHLDGFLDVTDAIGSCRSLQRRREILKDSHVGSFAVIGCCLLMLAGFACCAESRGSVQQLIFIPVISRCCSALAVTLLRPMSTSQYAGAFREGVSPAQPVMLTAMLITALIINGVLFGSGIIISIGQIAGYLLALRKGFLSLDGMNGDISGYALTLSELTALAIWAII